MEMDFIYNDRGKVTALEVKSGRNIRSRSLRTLCTIERKVPAGIELAEWNVAVDENSIIQLPLFAPFFFEEVYSDNVSIDDDVSDISDEFDRVLRDRENI